MNYSSRIAGFNRKKKILGFVMSQSIARGLLRHYTTLWSDDGLRRANTDVGGCRDARYSIYDTKKKTIFTAVICVYRTFYGLQHQCHTKTAQKRTSPQHLTQFTPPAVAGKKRTAILFTVARARFKCVFFIVNQTCHIARRRSESVMKTVNRIIAHVTNYVICAYPARKWLNFALIFTDHSSAREIISTLHRHQAATNLDFACVCCFCTDILIIHMELNAFCNVFVREILMLKLYDQNQNLADVVSILRDAIATLHQPNPGPVLAHCSICIVVRSIH